MLVSQIKPSPDSLHPYDKPPQSVRHSWNSGPEAAWVRIVGDWTAGKPPVDLTVKADGTEFWRGMITGRTELDLETTVGGLLELVVGLGTTGLGDPVKRRVKAWRELF